jgi:hypothetical protein
VTIALDAARPPDSLEAAVVLDPNDGVLTYGIGVERVVNDGQVVKVERPREYARSQGD